MERTMASSELSWSIRRTNAAVDLHLADRHPAQVGQRRVAGAEPVDGDPHAERRQLTQPGQASCCRSVTTLLSAISRVSRSAGRPCVSSSRATVSGSVVSASARAGRLTETPRSQSGLAASSAQALIAAAEQVPGELAGQPAAGRGRYELLRHQQAALRVLPARQDLDADDLAGDERRDRLGVDAELAVGQRAAQLAGEGELLGVGLAHARLPEPQAAVGGLRRVHRHVGALEQARRLDAVTRRERDADRHADRDDQIGQRDRLGDGAQHPLTGLGGGLCGQRVGQQDRELVAAEAGEHVAGGQRAGARAARPPAAARHPSGGRARR